MKQLIDIFIIQKINEIFKDSMIAIFLIYIVHYISSNNVVTISPESIKKNINRVLIYFFNKRQLRLEGNRTFIYSAFSNDIVESFSYRFNAVWFYITDNIYNNSKINEIREMMNVKQPDGKKKDIFIVSQKNHFIVDKESEIYASINVDCETNQDEKSSSGGGGCNVRFKIEKIEIVLYSYRVSLTEIEKFVNKITENYLNSIKHLRKNRLYYYIQTEINSEKDIHNCFKEIPFDSSRTFTNLFFPEKDFILEKIQFFVENKEWYNKMGIPYTLGIGIHGPPGTGKTSFLKCLANHLGRHIVELSFKLIKTKKQLQDFYFETRYNYNNQEDGIGFDKKIIIFEDLDCAGDIFLDRDLKKQKKNTDNKVVETEYQILSNIAQSLDKTDKVVQNPQIFKFNEDELITLDDILNLWDGLYETPGRIIVISSNHYNTLDPALIRPGRIDISLEMKRVTKKTIKEMFFHFFEFPLIDPDLQLFREDYYTPAEIVSIYISSNKDPVKFMDTILSHKKI